MSNQDRIKHVPAGTGPAFWGPGDQLTFLLTGEDTEGKFFMAHASVPPGGGPPPHVHRREDESFYLMEGALTVEVGGKTLEARPGDFIHLPRGIVHSFKNQGTGNATMLVMVTPAGLERYFAETFDPAGDRAAAPPPPSPEMIARLMAAAPRYGIELLG